MDLRKLQRVVVDALDDVKAQDIRVFNTTDQTELFDRVIVATGTSNRQTRALAAHVRDKVKAAGGTVVSMEGGDTGEWVLVDLGDAVVHIMQPAIRAYYNLEEIWGTRPVRILASRPAPAGPSARTPAAAPAKPAAKKVPGKQVPANKASAKKTPVKKASPKKAPAKKAPAKRTAAAPAAPSRPRRARTAAG